MKNEEKVLRLEEAVSYLVSLGLIDGKAIAKDIADKMNRNKNNISATLNGKDKYFTWKFVKDFCATFNNTISPYWIWEGKGDMLKTLNEISIDKEKINKKANVSEESLSKLTREELIILVKQLMALHSEQTATYQMLIHQNDQMIRNGQERFNNITNIISKNV